MSFTFVALGIMEALSLNSFTPQLFDPFCQVVWNNVRVLKDGETVSVDGTHLGHDLPDRSGHRYCINLVSVAGHPV